VAELGELGPNLGGVGVFEVVEDADGLLPDVGGLVVVTGRVPGVAEPSEALGLEETGAGRDRNMVQKPALKDWERQHELEQHEGGQVSAWQLDPCP
jgi:hypothetical protein